MKKLLLFLFVFLFTSINCFAYFTDVNSDTLYFNSIQWLEREGVIVGYDDGTFKPDQYVNRAEFLKMLYETLDIQNFDVSGIENPFSDVPSDEWYTPYLLQAYDTGIIDGYPDNTFKPEQNINIVEALKIVSNAFLDVNYLFENGDNYSPCYGWEKADLSSILDTNSWYWTYLYVSDGRCIIPDNMVYLDEEIVFEGSNKVTRGEMAELLYRSKAVKDNSENHIYTIFTKDLVPEPIKSENEFHVDEIQEGFSINDLSVLSIAPVIPQSENSSYSKDNITISFGGQLEIDGQYQYYEEGILNGYVCIEPNDLNILPKLINDQRTPYFCFSNFEDAQKEFGPPSSSDNTNVLIDNYTYNFAGTTVWNTARLVEVYSID